MVRLFLQWKEAPSNNGLTGSPFESTKIASKADVIRKHYGKYQVIQLNLGGMPNKQFSFQFVLEKYRKCIP